MQNNLHHSWVVKEYWKNQKDNNTLFQLGWIELVEKWNKTFIKINTSKFWQYFPAEFRKILENPNIREINELKNRITDFLNPKIKSNSLEWVPVRLAFSTFPLVYTWFNSKILSLIESWEISFKEILEYSWDFNIDLTINNNPNWFFWSLTPINAKLIDSISKANEILFKEKINKILKWTNAKIVKSEDDLWLIISDWKNEQIIEWYNYTFDKKVAWIEMWKTTVRNPSELILDDLEDWKQERINTNINLKTLIDYFNNYYTTSKNKDWAIVEFITPTLKIFDENQTIEIWDCFVWSYKINNLNSLITKYSQNKDTKKANEYKKLSKKLIFNNKWKASIKIKDLQLTPPLILWLEKLLKEWSYNNCTLYWNTLTNKNKEIENISNNYEKIMFEILWKKWESKIVYSVKNTKKAKYKVKTPDHIEQINKNEIIIYDFKISSTKTNYDDFIDENKYELKYKSKVIKANSVQIISLDKKIAEQNVNCIYFRDFIKQKNIFLTKAQKAKLNKIEADYNFSIQQFSTNKKAQKILQ